MAKKVGMRTCFAGYEHIKEIKYTVADYEIYGVGELLSIVLKAYKLGKTRK